MYIQEASKTNKTHKKDGKAQFASADAQAVKWLESNPTKTREVEEQRKLREIQLEANLQAHQDLTDTTIEEIRCGDRAPSRKVRG